MWSDIREPGGYESYRPAYNPEFLKRARERQRKAEAERLARERELKKQKAIAARKRWEAEMRERQEAAQKAKEADGRFISLAVELEERRRKKAQEIISVFDIIVQIAQKHGVRVDDIKGQSRTRPVIRARFEAIAEARRLRPDLSLTQLGRQFNRDHTSILHALRRMGMPTASIEGQKVAEGRWGKAA